MHVQNEHPNILLRLCLCGFLKGLGLRGTRQNHSRVSGEPVEYDTDHMAFTMSFPAKRGLTRSSVGPLISIYSESIQTLTTYLPGPQLGPSQ